MEKNFNYSSQSLLDLKFEPSGKGYNPILVDETLDKVILDYKLYDEEIKKANNENSKLLKDINNLKEDIKKLELEMAKLQNKLNSLPKGNLNEDNYQLLKRVNAYERVLYRKGIDLKKALSDPDNC